MFPNAPESYPCEGASKSGEPDNDDGSQEGLGELVHEKTLQVEYEETKCCYLCHELLPPLPEDASYVDEINHYAHEECLEVDEPGEEALRGHEAAYVRRHRRFASRGQ